MQRFCGDEWEGSLLAESDLQPCIQSLMLRIPPPLLIIIPWGAWRLWTLRDRPQLVDLAHVEPRAPLAALAMQLLIALIALIWTLATGREAYLLLEYSVCLLGWLVNLALVYRERRCQMRLHPCSRLYWIIDFVTSLKCVESTLVQSVHDHPFDDDMLISLMRWPASLVLCYMAVVWQRRGYDDDAEPEMRAVTASAQTGGLRALRSPREYLVVGDEEASFASDGVAAQHPQGLWDRFLRPHRTGGRDDDDDNIDPVSMHRVNHIDSASFVRVDGPLPRSAFGTSPSSTSMMSPPQPQRRDPSLHPLCDAHVAIPNVTESQGGRGNRTMVQFTVRIQIVSARFASGDESIDSMSIAKKFREFEGLHDLLSLTASKWHADGDDEEQGAAGVRVPPFPPSIRDSESLDVVRENLEGYLQAVMSEPIFWDDVADWVRLAEKIELIRSHKIHMKRMARAKSSASSSMASSPAVGGASSLALSLSSPSFASDGATTMGASPARERGHVGWILIGINVTAWMRWQPALASQIADSPDEMAASSSSSSSSAGASYVTFQIRVRSSLGTYNVHRTVEEIHAVRAAIVSRLGSTSASVPSLRIEKEYDRDDTTLAAARQAIEVFLQSIVGIALFECNELYTALAQQSHPRKRVTNDRMIACSDPSLLPPEVAAAAANAATAAASPSGAGGAASSSSSAVASPILPVRSESIAIAGSANSNSSSSSSNASRKSRPDRMSVSLSTKGVHIDGGAGSMARKISIEAEEGSSVLASPIMLGQSINSAEVDYFAAARGDGATSSTGADGGGATAAASAALPSPSSSVQSTSRRFVPAHSPSHHTGSYLDADGALDDASAADDSDDDESDPDDHSSGVPESGSGSSSSTGVLPPSATLSSHMGPNDHRRFTVTIREWTRVSAKDSEDAAAATDDKDAKKKKKKGGSSSDHIEYVIVVREFFELSTYLEWTVRRRFQQFHRLHRSLESQCGGSVSLPRLPSKTLFAPSKKQSAAFLDARRQQLELYIQQLINNTAFQTEALFTFFEINNASRSITMGNLKHRA